MRRLFTHPFSVFTAIGGVATGFISAVSAQTMEVTQYEYDALGRLITVERAAAGKTAAYSFDGAGNRQTVTQTSVPPAAFSINDVSVTEGGALNFTVSKTAGPAQTYNVSYTTANGSAGSGDYTPTSGVLSFSPSETSKPVTVQTTQDVFFEHPETVLVNLSNPTNGSVIADGQGVGTISNDDAAPTFSINNPSVSEGGNLNFIVSKTGQTALTHSVTYSTADGSAVAGSDYTPVASAVLTFSPSQTSRTAVVATIEDSIAEPDETVLVNLSNATGGALISDSQGIGSILNDDNAPPVTRNDSVTVWEGAGSHVYVLNNDTDPENDPLTISSISIVFGGYAFSASIACSNKCIRVMGLSHGSGTIRYWASDGNSSSPGNLSVNVVGTGSLD